MSIATLLESLCKWLLLLSLAAMGITHFYKDKLPEPAYFDLGELQAPRQTKTAEQPFNVEAGGQQYVIDPKFDYELDGVVVSYHDADDISDIWHHKDWKDFLNLRDLCVIWGDNVASGVYKRMDFNNDSWTCWAYWPDQATGAQFKGNALSNNHLLTDKEEVAKALMAAEPGDHIRFKGMLAEYSNPGNGFRRGTSTSRDDRNNGACETVYVDEFAIVNKANRKLRSFYSFAKGLAIVSGIGFALMFMIAPARGRD